MISSPCAGFIFLLSADWEEELLPYILFVADIVYGAKLFHVEKFVCIWQAILHHMTNLFVLWNSFVMWSIGIWNGEQCVISPHDNFWCTWQIYNECCLFMFSPVLTQYLIHALFSGAKIYPKILCVEQKLQKWCMVHAFLLLHALQDGKNTSTNCLSH